MDGIPLSQWFKIRKRKDSIRTKKIANDLNPQTSQPEQTINVTTLDEIEMVTSQSQSDSNSDMVTEVFPEIQGTLLTLSEMLFFKHSNSS